MDVQFSFMGIGISIGLIFLLLIIATILLFLAPQWLKTTATDTVTKTIADNNVKASSYIYASAIILLISLVLYVVFTYFSYRKNDNLLSADAIDMQMYGWGTFILLFILFLMLIAAVVLAFIGYSFIDASTINSGGETARVLTLIGAIMAAVTLFPLFYILYKMIVYNYNLKTYQSQFVIEQKTDTLIKQKEEEDRLLAMRMQSEFEADEDYYNQMRQTEKYNQTRANKAFDRVAYRTQGTNPRYGMGSVYAADI